MGNRLFVVVFTFFLLVSGSVSPASSLSFASPPAKIFGGFFSNVVSILMKWVWSLKPATKIVNPGRPLMKFESGYSVETVFDGSKLGIEPHSIQVLPDGELLILDSENSNIYKISASLSLYSRPRLIAGSPEGYSGHVDGRMRDSRMNHPKGLTIDDKGNIYIADTMNMAIRKISDTGITTIAGGKGHGGGGHVDGPSQDAKFSNDFDVIYVGSSCSLLVIDRGNQAIREIQLRFDDCAYQYGSGFPLGIVVLIAAAFFGYMLALLQRRVGTIISSQVDEKTFHFPLKPPNSPLITTGDESEKQEEGFLASLGRLFMNAGSSLAEILSGFKRKPPTAFPHQNPQTVAVSSTAWPIQDSYEILDEDAPRCIETRNATPQKMYPFMTEDAQKVQDEMRRNVARTIFCQPESQKSQHSARVVYGQPESQKSQHAARAVYGQQESQKSQYAAADVYGQPKSQKSQKVACTVYGQPESNKSQHMPCAVNDEQGSQKSQHAAYVVNGQLESHKSHQASAFYSQPESQKRQHAAYSVYGQPEYQKTQQARLGEGSGWDPVQGQYRNGECGYSRYNVRPRSYSMDYSNGGN